MLRRRYRERDINAATNILKVAGGQFETKNGRRGKQKTVVKGSSTLRSVNPIQRPP